MHWVLLLHLDQSALGLFEFIHHFLYDTGCFGTALLLDFLYRLYQRPIDIFSTLQPHHVFPTNHSPLRLY